MTGLAGVGAYAPASRIAAEEIGDALGQYQAAGITRTAVPDADEDVLTMAHEAATLALEAADREPGSVAGLFVGTTTPPYEEEAMAPRLVSTLGLDDDVATGQLEGSTRAGVDALVVARERTREAEAPVLAVASDAPRGAPDDAIEHGAGAGAAALLVAPDGPGRLGEPAEHASPFPGTRFREAGDDETQGLGVTEYDRRAFRETVAAAADALDGALETADAVALQSPDGGLPYRAAGALGVDEETIQAGTTVHELGDTGAASPLLGLASALSKGHEAVPVIGYGSGGGATALAVEGGSVPVQTALEAVEDLSYPAYLRRRGELTTGEPEGGGAYVSVPSWKRTIPQRHRLVAGECAECGELAFPPAGACSACGTLDDYESVELPGTGTVEAATVIGQGGAPPEFVEQQARGGSYVSAIVALDGPDGRSVSVPLQVLREGDESVSVGDRVAATIRRIYAQEGVARYGVKMRLAG
jgi:hydroxymethylglutaryl-CoA synthase